MRTVNQRPSRVATCFSLKTRVRSTSLRVVGELGVVEVGGDVGDGAADVAGMSLMIFVVGVVKRRTCRSSSRNRVAMSVLLSRFFMSLLARDSSSTLACSSWLTVCSSSFSDCISSFEVVSSSLVLCSSSLVDCSSSLVDLQLLLRGLHLLAGGLQLLARLLELAAPARRAARLAGARRGLATAAPAARRPRRVAE